MFNPVGNPKASKCVGLLVAVIWKLNDWPAVPFAVVALVMTGGGGETVIVIAWVPVPAAFVALNETLNVPVAPGVPVMAPVAVFTLRPAGKPLALKLVGELLAVI